MSNKTHKAISAAFDIPLISGVCVDSRLIQPGELFFALPGQKNDGHQFIHEIINKGACAAVVLRSYDQEHGSFPLIRVDDVLQSLQQLTAKILAERQVKIVAITGSVGKTTTKEFTATLLRQKFRSAHSPGNQNSQIGIPLSILNHTTGDEEVLILEMGMTDAGHIAQLLQIAPPDIAILTSVELVHAGFFNSLEDIAKAKSEIFTHPKTKVGILPRDLEHFDLISKMGVCPKLSYSTRNRAADYFLKELPGDQVMIHFEQDRIIAGPLPVIGSHNRHNFLAAVVAARQLGVSWEQIQQGALELRLPERRMQQVEKQGILFINDSYNASEVSVKCALESLPTPSPGRKKIAVLGDMLELGKFSEQCHRAVGEYALKHVEMLFCTGNESKIIADMWQDAKRPAVWCATREELIQALKRAAEPGDVVLVKGSRSMQMWKVLEEYAS